MHSLLDGVVDIILSTMSGDCINMVVVITDVFASFDSVRFLKVLES